MASHMAKSDENLPSISTWGEKTVQLCANPETLQISKWLISSQFRAKNKSQKPDWPQLTIQSEI